MIYLEDLTDGEEKDMERAAENIAADRQPTRHEKRNSVLKQIADAQRAKKPQREHSLRTQISTFPPATRTNLRVKQVLVAWDKESKQPVYATVVARKQSRTGMAFKLGDQVALTMTGLEKLAGFAGAGKLRFPFRVAPRGWKANQVENRVA